MAHSKLHIICGNCGCNHMFEYDVSIETDDATLQPRSVVYITCKNCNTVHDLDDYSAFKSE